MLIEKIDWNDTEGLCASEELTERARETTGGKPCLFLTFNDCNGCAEDTAIKTCLVSEYPKNVLYEDIKADWGQGCNLFLFGKELLGNNEDFDEEEVWQSIFNHARERGYVNDVEERLIREEWYDYCGRKGIDPKNDKVYDSFEAFMYSDALMGAYGIEYNEADLDTYMAEVN